MDSAFIHQAANELVQNAGTRNIKQIARSCSLDISETSRIKDMFGLLSLYFDKPLILINRQLDKQTKQMVCGYALGHYLEHQLLMNLHTLNKFLTIKDKHILLYEHNAFTSHLMLDSDEVYQMTKRGLDAAQIAATKGIHLNLVLVKLLELHHLGYDLRCINRREFAICTEKTCHSIGDFPPPRRPPSTKKLCRQSHRQSSEILIFYFGYWNIVLL